MMGFHGRTPFIAMAGRRVLSSVVAVLPAAPFVHLGDRKQSAGERQKRCPFARRYRLQGEYVAEEGEVHSEHVDRLGDEHSDKQQQVTAKTLPEELSLIHISEPTRPY